jgi:hypothetical protein
MIGRYMVLAVESNNECSISVIPAYFVDAGFFSDEFSVLTRQAELRVNPTVAFHAANFNVGDVCELVCHKNL